MLTSDSMTRLLWVTLLAAGLLSGATPSDTAWGILAQGAADENSAKRAEAVSAIGSIRLARATRMVEAALSDKDHSVRLAAVIALADRNSRAAIPTLKTALDDEAAEVSFTAAQALWQMGDRSGRDLLVSVLAGERKQSASFLTRSMRDAKSTLRNRKALVWMGAKEGAGFLFGPLGYGLGIVEGITKDDSAPARALAARLLAEEKNPALVDELTAALDDKSPLVRVAAAKALGGFSDPKLIPKISPLLEDKHEAVRYMAAASIVRLSQPPPRR